MSTIVMSLALTLAQNPPPLPAPHPLPPGGTVPAPAPIVVAGPTIIDQPISHYEFARVVKPLPGKYDVCFLHPTKCCPVRVCFTLPPGCPCVRTEKRRLIFDYGHCCVTIRFRILFKSAHVIYN
ncbi:MAG: hypothetical protein KatS3mg105_1134 [Gemmatales bacterium]|nr:MAG: hypothetical protein KatS3mg105_1134 [Gemmatales bacterium]